MSCGCGCGGATATCAQAPSVAAPTRAAVPTGSVRSVPPRQTRALLLPAPFRSVAPGPAHEVLPALVAAKGAQRSIGVLTPGPGAVVPGSSWAGGRGPSELPARSALLLDNVRVHWGSVDREVPLRWWLDYEGNERFTKVDTFLKVVWSDVMHAINAHGIDLGALDDQIGSFNIDADLATNGVYDKLFFRHTNGAREFLRYTMAMISAYHSYAEESWSGTTYCVGFPEFLGKLFKGRRAENRLGTKCFLRVHARSDDERFDGERVRTCAPGAETADPCGARAGPGIRSGPSRRARQRSGLRRRSGDVGAGPMIFTFLLLAAACGTAGDTALPVCEVIPLGAHEHDNLEEEIEMCAQQMGMTSNDVRTCGDGTVEFYCQSDLYVTLRFFDAEGELVGTMDPAGTPWYDWEGEPEGYGVWFDCNGDGWPPTVEEYCELRGEALPE